MNTKNITIIGAIGTRIDHVLANINILKIALDNKIDARIIDENNEIKLLNRKTDIKKCKEYKYISFIPLTTYAEGITLKGFKYEIENYTLQVGDSIGVSNEQILDIAQVDINNGILMMIKSKD